MKQFQKVQAQKPKRSAFDLSNRRVATFNPGDLLPVGCYEVLPGDTFQMDFEAFMRTMPLVSPVMHHINLYAHAFFVPNRLLLASGNPTWEDFITGKVETDLPCWDPSYWAGESALADLGPNSLVDHLGFGDFSNSNTAPYTGKLLSQMPLRAYHKIWSDYYRDQNFQPEVDFSTNSLSDNITNGVYDEGIWLFRMRKRCFEKDYFTGSLPTQQRGSAVTLPLGTTAPVSGSPVFNTTNNDTFSGAAAKFTTISAPSKNHGMYADDGSPVSITGMTGLSADLSGATASTISQLRQAFALQRWYEASMRFGQRYVEQLLGLFGVVSKDARLQRSEFLAGGKLPVQIGEVLQTSSTDSESPQGNMSGRAVSTGNMFSFNKTFDEHGYIMIIVSCIPRTSYINVCERQNFKLDRFDFAFPQFAHLSEQPVYNAEIFQENVSTQSNAFGYNPIYTEYRYKPDTYHGDLKNSLSYWGLGRSFSTLPTLSEAFMLAEFPQNIFPVEAPSQQLILQTFAKVKAIRPLPQFGTPI